MTGYQSEINSGNRLTQVEETKTEHLENENLRLVKLTRDGDNKAFDKLVETYNPLIISLVKKYDLIIREISGISEPEDLYQEATIALYRAAMTYIKDSGVTFGLYAKICIRNKLISETRSAKTEHLSFEDAKLERETDRICRDPSSDIINSESIRQFVDSLGSILTSLEINVLRQYLAGKSYKEIATEMSKNEKTVDNALRRIKTKLKGRKLY